MSGGKLKCGPSARCACGAVATHYSAGPRCERCRELEAHRYARQTHNGGVRTERPALDAYAVLLPARAWEACA
jgi:hypothetical protein